MLLFLAADGRLSAASRVGDIDEIDRCLEIMGSTVEKLGQPTLNWRLMHVRATRAQIAGDPERAEELATEALQIGTDGGEPDAALIFSSQMAVVTYQRGTMGELVPFIKEAAVENPGLPVLVAALAMAYGEGDQTDHARELLEEFAATGFYLPMNSRLAHRYGRRTEAPPSNAGILSSPYRCSTDSPRGLMNGRRPGAQRWRARSAIPSADLRACSVDTTRRTPTSPTPLHRVNERMRSSSPPGHTSCGEGCLPRESAPGTLRRLMTFLLRPTPPQWPTDTGPWSVVPPPLSGIWTSCRQQAAQQGEP